MYLPPAAATTCVDVVSTGFGGRVVGRLVKHSSRCREETRQYVWHHTRPATIFWLGRVDIVGPVGMLSSQRFNRRANGSCRARPWELSGVMVANGEFKGC